MNRFLQDLYAIAGHWATTRCPVVNDRLSYKMLTAEEQTCCTTMAEKAVMPLADRVFMARTFTGARAAGAKQRVFLHTGYDTFAINQSLWYDGIQVFDLNPSPVSADKQHRLEMAGERRYSNIHYADCADILNAGSILMEHPAFESEKTTFVRVGCIPADRKSFKQFLAEMFKVLSPYSSLVFSYSNENSTGGYSYNQMEALLSASGFRVYEHVTTNQLHSDCFADFEILNRRRFPLAGNISFCLAVKKEKGSEP